MKESTTYQAILQEGRQEGRQEGQQEGRLAEARAILLRQGRKRFGQPSDEVVSALEAIQDLERLEWLGERLLDVSAWEELIAEP